MYVFIKVDDKVQGGLSKVIRVPGFLYTGHDRSSALQKPPGPVTDSHSVHLACSVYTTSSARLLDFMPGFFQTPTLNTQCVRKRSKRSTSKTTENTDKAIRGNVLATLETL